MLSNIAIAALAAIGTVSAGPLQRRQQTSSAVEAATSAVESAVSSAVESATSGASSAASGASSAVSGATSTGAESSAASSTAASSAASSTGVDAGNQTYPAYPCPAGFLLTYASVNQTVPVPVTQVTQAAGQWADSPLFPNVTNAMGGNDAGATHTINVGGISLPEVLVSAVSNTTSGSAIWNWNGSLTEPVSAMGVSLSNYSTVLQIYDPDYTTTGMIGNTTLIKIFTNACATPQAEAVQLLSTLGGLELSNIAGALSGGNMTGGSTTAAESSMPMSSTMMMSGSSMMSSSMMMSSGATDSATSATSAAASGVESAVSGATSAAASAVSGATSTSA